MSIRLLDVAGKTDPGKVRERNEDSIALDPELGLYIVADGMGGHNSGEVASGLATDTILKFGREMLSKSREFVPPETDETLSVRARQIVYLIQSANTMIYEKSKAFAKNQGMGTTVVVVIGDTKSITVGHVGDSRLYRLRGSNFEQLTEDHSLVQDQVRHGLITKEQADKSNLQNILTRALGTEPNVLVDTQDIEVQPGDAFLICSDGMTKMVTDDEAGKVMSNMKEPLDAVDKLIDMSNAAGGVDNVTIIVAAAPGGKPQDKGLFARLKEALE
ncbi:MAG: Stp1/IreP family PP2C-type Ser/Thr phosphatase [Elusimicrobiota bacterium]